MRLFLLNLTVLCIAASNIYSQVPTLDELSFRVVGFPRTAGLVKLEAFNSAQSFIEQIPLKEAESEYINRFSDNYVYVRLEGLPVGRYVIRMYHDENEDGTWDADNESYAYYSPNTKLKKSDDKEDVSIFEEMNFLYRGGEIRELIKLSKP